MLGVIEPGANITKYHPRNSSCPPNDGGSDVVYVSSYDMKTSKDCSLSTNIAEMAIGRTTFNSKVKGHPDNAD